MHKYNEDGKKYYGEWQKGSTIMQKLEGPKGEGAIDYPNGDRFEGCFHLNFAHIGGPAYSANGMYIFSNGDVVPECWIDGADRLMGVYRMNCKDGSVRIAMWVAGKKQGMEVIEGESPVLIEYLDDKEIARWNEGVVYTYKESPDAENQLEVVVPDGRSITQKGGEVACWTTSPKCEVVFPDGNIFCYRGDTVYRNSQPWSGYGIFFDAKTGKSIDGEWKEGEQIDDEAEWKYDVRGAKSVMIPTDPFGNKLVEPSWVWKDRIMYTEEKIYEGPVEDNLPEGKGVYTDSELVEYKAEPRKYEGDFHHGLCQGQGKFTYPSTETCMEGLWANGKFIDEDAPAEPIMLHVNWTDNEWTMSGGGKTRHDSYTIEATVGRMTIEGFRSVSIEKICSNAIVFKEYGGDVKILTPGDSVRFENSIDGYEDHDGCVWDGDDYVMTITWEV